MLKRLFILFFVFIFVFLIFLKENNLISFNQSFLKNNFLKEDLKKIKINFDNFKREDFIGDKKINILFPLINKNFKKEGVLTREGIINFTNKLRLENNLELLKENEKLNQMAELKIKDMVENQYFSHQLANQKNLDYLAELVDYKFIKLGENLAKGYFENDEELVLAWFNSPGHKANILNSKYKEIGVAVKKVIFEGELVWLAVQHFGTSLSYCENTNLENLKKEIDLKKKDLENLNNLLIEKRKYLTKENYLSFYEFRNLLDHYNILIEKYNTLLNEVNYLINSYNREIQEFNACLEFYR